MLSTTEGLCSPKEAPLVRQSIEVQHHGQGSGVPRSVDYATGSVSGERETKGSTQLGEAPNSEGCQIVSGVCKLLSPLHLEICGDSSPINVFDQERCGDALGSSSAAGVPAVKGRPVRCADAGLPRS